jgi:hypothetical protein
LATRVITNPRSTSMCAARDCASPTRSLGQDG